MMNPYYGSSSFGSPPSLVTPPSRQFIHPHLGTDVQGNDARGIRMLHHHHPNSNHNGMGFSDSLFSRQFYGPDLMTDVNGVTSGGNYGDIDNGLLRNDYPDRLGGMGTIKPFSSHSMMIPHLRRNQSLDESENLMETRNDDDVMEGRYNPHSLMRSHQNNSLQGMHNNSTNTNLMSPMSHLSGMSHQAHHPMLDDSYENRLSHSLNPPSCTSSNPSGRFMSPHLHNNNTSWRQTHLLQSNHNTPSIHSPNNNHKGNSPLKSQTIIQSTKSDDQFSSSPTNTPTNDSNNTVSTSTSLSRNTNSNTTNSISNSSNSNSGNNNVPFYPWMSVVG